MLHNFHRTLRHAACLLAISGALSVAFGQIEQGPKTTPGNTSGGGVGIGINIDIGTIFNAIKNLRKNDEPPKPPVLQKKAVTVSSGSSGNYTIDWVVQYANNTGATLPSATVRDGPIATIIANSLQQPLGWTGMTNASPPPIDNFAQWTGANIAPHGVMTASLGSTSPPNVTVAGSGDGYSPIPYSHSKGLRVYLVNHHSNVGELNFKCVDTTTGLACAGWPKQLPLGDGSGFTSTTQTPVEYVISGGKLYYSANNDNATTGVSGIGCFDLELDVACGFKKLNDVMPDGNHLLQGPWKVGNEMYFTSYAGDLFCATLAVNLPACVGNAYKIPNSTIKIKTAPSGAYGRGGRVAGVVVGDRLFITSKDGDLASSKKYTNCFNGANHADKHKVCWGLAPGTGSHSFASESDYGNVSNFVYFDPSGSPKAICTLFPFALPKQQCVNLLNGNSITLPLVLPATKLGAGLETHIWPRTYFVASLYQSRMFSNLGGYQDNVWCWDWITSNYCQSSATSIAYTPGRTNDLPLGKQVSTQTYGSNVDDVGCIWVYGHDNILWNFDPSNVDPVSKKAMACGGGSGKTTKVFQPLQYCSGPKPFRWLNVEVKGAPLANYTKFVVKVLDSTSNAVLLTKDLLPSGPMKVDITSLDAQTISKPLKIEIEYTPKPGVTDKPYLEVRYDAPPAEFCFKSKHTCEQKSISNVVETPDPTNPQKFISVKVDVPAPQDCKISPPPVCGQPGQPPCPTCGTPTTPPCPACGQAGQPPCPVCGTANTPACNSCGMPGQPPCVCIPGTPGCVPPPPPPPVCAPGSIGWPACLTCANPPCSGTPKVMKDDVCLTPPCADKPPQSVSEEFKEPKTGCVRKAKPAPEAVAAPKPKPVVKPKPKPAVTDAPAAFITAPQPSVAAPKPKPRPVAKPKPKVEDDCE